MLVNAFFSICSRITIKYYTELQDQSVFLFKTKIEHNNNDSIHAFNSQIFYYKTLKHIPTFQNTTHTITTGKFLMK